MRKFSLPVAGLTDDTAPPLISIDPPLISNSPETIKLPLGPIIKSALIIKYSLDCRNIDSVNV